MKKLNSKSLMVLTIIVASTLAMPAMVSGYGTDDNYNLDQFEGGELIGGFRSGFGNIFRPLGYAGDLLGTLFELLFTQGLNLTNYEVLESVYVLNASVEKTSQPQTYSFSGSDIRYLPDEYYGESYNYSTNGYAYCEVSRSGSYNITYETGAAITLIIWDNDKSFINALTRLISFFRKFMNAGPDMDMETLISEGVSVITWFLIHINDIFTGDELFVLNPITWNKMDLQVSEDFYFNKTWKYTGENYIRDDTDLEIPQSVIDQWRAKADTKKDEYTKWLLEDRFYPAGTHQQWTQFSFDLLQLWIKNFHIEINVDKILGGVTGGGEPNFAEVFGGCNIDFYFFTHHLTGAFLYNDSNADNQVTVKYDKLRTKTTNETIQIDGKDVEIPTTNEITHRIHLQEVADYQFQHPTIEGQKVKWGLNMDDVLLSPVPIGVDTESYLDTTNEHLEYIFFGFEFIPRVSGSLAQGKVKLDQFFAPWNGNGIANADIAGLDLSILYSSTVLHFTLNIETEEEDPSTPLALLKEEDYRNETKSLSIGNYLGTSGRELEFVDIAGLNYTYGLDELSATETEAYSAIIPVALWEAEYNAHETVEYGENETQVFSADIGLDITFDILGYAVSYPEFNGGNGIWHDPTFNVFMVFEPTIFWALILLIGGVSLVGVATILVKRKKDGRTPFK